MVVCDLKVECKNTLLVDIDMLPVRQFVAEVEACTDTLLQAAIFTLGTDITDKERQ